MHLPRWIAGLLLVAAFLFSASRIWRAAGKAGDDMVTIRFAHWRLEEPTVSSLDALARDYERLHPGVRVEQLAIPLRAWRAWLQTQLVGAMAPDLIVAAYGVNDETLGRHFVPLTSYVGEANPYNEGTALEGVPWRETFVDGMATPNYNPNLLEYFTAPISGNTFRLYYNLDLVRELTGRSEPPAHLAELEALAAAATIWSLERQQPLVVLAGAYDRSLPLFDRLFQWQMQGINSRIDLDGNLIGSFEEMSFGYLEGRWSFQVGAPRQTLELIGTIGRMSQPGYLGQRQDDALFLFFQKRAVAMIGASWDAANIRRLADFGVGVADLPFPCGDDPRYGGPGMARTSEASTALNLSFGLTRYSRHPGQALDFLRFLTSLGANERFSRESENIPSVVGVVPEETTRLFMPVVDGSVPGFTAVYSTSVRGATNRIYETALHELTNPGGTVDAFLSRFLPDYVPALLDDLRRDVRFALVHARRADSVLGCAVRDPADEDRRVSVFFETQNQQESTAARIAFRLARPEWFAPSPP